ncbi:hypothetical protein HLB44_07460 [Aquincola sp. S2]|uniref:Right handed beta helix domain-containing protein n=1 Tax=Pseudaquabacterium terrae TaxID=2732868 RepID=A0ABX2EDW7_9BURK|nr:hypothetical protein [Aquabacterium terrae]NRF66816.1 hypothetical protein [Aquabacterium terrae]
MRLHHTLLAATVLTASAGAMGQTCFGNASSTGAQLQAAINGATGVLYLCQGAVFTADASILLKNNLKMETLGRPSDDNQKAKIVLAYTSAQAISTGFPFPVGQSFLSGYGMSGVELRNIVIDGGRTSVTIASHKTDSGATPDHHRATLAIGGVNSLLDRVTIRNGIGGALVDAASDANCSGLRITNSYFGPAGYHQTLSFNGSSIGQWSDGLNLYCGNAYVAGNQFRDITDGSISFYGGTSTTIESNWIALSGRSGVSGFVAAAALARTRAVSFLNSAFRYNLIETASNQHLNVAIGLGSRAWCNPAQNNPDCDTVSGMSATNNSGSGNYGFGLLVAGMTPATLLDNNLVMQRWINPDWVSIRPHCQGPDANAPGNPPPWPAANYYVVRSGTAGSLQPGYALRTNVDGCAWVPSTY